MNKTLNCIGMACPLPVVNAKKAFSEFTEDGTLTVKVDNEIAVQNLTRLAQHSGYGVSSAQKGEKEYEVTMEIKTGVKTSENVNPEDYVCSVSAPGARPSKVVILSGDAMGTGDEALGKKLMKAFIFALTSQDTVPDKIICYNRGAFLTTENPDTIKDLKSLEEAGTTIMTCGTCLDYYGLKEKLQVGIISNMYDICEAQMNATEIIRP